MRKRVLLVCIVLLPVGIFYAYRRQNHNAPELFFLEKLHAIETAVPPVWPGFNSAKAPLIIRFAEEGALLVGLPPKADSGFLPIKNIFPGDYKTPENSFFRPGYFEPWLHVFNLESYKSSAGAVHFSNYNLMQGILCRDVLFHEYFHSYQKRYFKQPYTRQFFSPGLSPEQAAAAYIEQLLLAEALRTPGPAWKHYARAFTALRLFKKRLRDPYSLNPREDALEVLEGTAVYFESRTRDFNVGNPGSGGAFPSQADLHIAGELLMTEFTPDMMLYWRQYNTGAAQGLLLDRAGADWKTGVQNGNSLFSLFSAVFDVPEAEQAELVNTAKSEYDYTGLVAVASRTMFPRETPFTGNDYAGRITLRTCGTPSIDAKPPAVPANFRFKDGTTAGPYESLKITQKNSFTFEADSFGAFSDIREGTSGKECRRLEISLLFPLSQLSIDKTACAPTPQGLNCKRLVFYGVMSEGHFETPVKLTERGKTLILEVEP